MTPPPMTPRIGEPVEDFEVVDEHGHPWRLSEQRGRPLLLIFHRHLF